MMDKLLIGIGALVAAVGIFTVVGGVFAVATMWLWNVCLVPIVPNLGELNFLHAWGINILANILFKPSGFKLSEE